jgi:hypothetical protein
MGTKSRDNYAVNICVRPCGNKQTKLCCSCLRWEYWIPPVEEKKDENVSEG